MEKYFAIDSVNIGELDKYLSRGWEIIQTTKSVHEYGDEVLYYHIGLPISTFLDNALSIINEYEKYGLKEKLFEIKAEELGENVSDITRIPYFAQYSGGNRTELAKYMESYDLKTMNKIVNYSQKSPEEDEFDF